MMPASSSSEQAWHTLRDNGSVPPSLIKPSEGSEVQSNEVILTILSAHTEHLDRVLATQWQKMDKAMVASREQFEMWFEKRCSEVEASFKKLAQETVTNLIDGDGLRQGADRTDFNDTAAKDAVRGDTLAQEIHALREDVGNMRIEVDGLSASLDLQDNKPPPPSCMGTVSFFNASNSEAEMSDTFITRRQFDDCWEEKSKAFKLLELVLKRQMEHEKACQVKFESITKELANHIRETGRHKLNVSSEIPPVAEHRGNLPARNTPNGLRTVDNAVRFERGEASASLGLRVAPSPGAPLREGVQQSERQLHTFLLDMRQGGPLGVLLEPCPNNVNLIIKEVNPGSPALPWAKQGDVINAVNSIKGPANMLSALRKPALHKITALCYATKN